MITCQQCGAWNLDLQPEQLMVAKKIGDFSLSGAQPKFSATVEERWRATCHCGWYVIGRLVDPVLGADGLTFISGHFEAKASENPHLAPR